MILGHNHPAVREAVIKACEKGLSYGAATECEVDIAELICSNVRNIEMVRMVNSGTEAVMSAIRTARGYTGRAKIVKFMGCYHGHSDALLDTGRLRCHDCGHSGQRGRTGRLHEGHAFCCLQ